MKKYILISKSRTIDFGGSLAKAIEKAKEILKESEDTSISIYEVMEEIVIDKQLK